MLILLASDKSPCALDAAAWVARHFDPATTTIRVVTVLEPLYRSISSPYMPAEVALPADVLDYDGQETVEATLERLPGFASTSVIRQGEPVQQILAECDSVHPDLLVVGHRGLSGWESFFLGSVAKALIHRAHIPVLVVPEDRSQPPSNSR